MLKLTYGCLSCLTYHVFLSPIMLLPV